MTAPSVREALEELVKACEIAEGFGLDLEENEQVDDALDNARAALAAPPSEIIHAQHDETGRMWSGERRDLPPRYAEIVAPKSAVSDTKPDAEVAGLRERLLKQATCIYIAAEPECADDVSDGLKKAVAMIDRLTATLAERDREVTGYRDLIRWLNGETDFRGREDGEGAYYWRCEMMRRVAALRAKDE